ncbi:MAG: PQQ-binding-like beta-propeller repeat protein, partial [Chloroflexota bacterium]
MVKTFKALTSKKPARFWLLKLVFVLLWMASLHSPSSAQTDKYWEFETQGRLLRTHTADLDRDGIEEVVLMDDSQTLTLLGADGQFIWSVPIPGLQVLDMVHINTRANSAGDSFLILATPGRLVWVDRNGDLSLDYDLPSSPIKITTIESSGSDTVLVATSTGVLELINGQTAQREWRFETEVTPNRLGAEPEFAVLPALGNAPAEILFSILTDEDTGLLTMLNVEGSTVWSKETENHQTSIIGIPQLIDGEDFVATGSSVGRLALLNRATGLERWFRTPNRPITSMQAAVIDGELGLVVGTDAGIALAYTVEGRPIWDREMGAGPEQGVIEIEVDGVESDLSTDSVIMIELEPQQTGARAGASEIVIPGPDGRPQGRYRGISEQAGGELTDLNGDGFPELLLTAFSTVSLQDAGADTEVTGFVTNWTWRLEAAPSALLEVTSAGNQTLAVLVAGEDGLLHNVSPVVGLPVWQQRVDGTIEYLESVFPPENPGSLPDILVGWNRTPSRDANNVLIGSSSGVDLKRLDGTSAWEIPVQIGSSITVIEVDNEFEDEDDGNPARRRQAQIYVGTQSGEILAFSYRGEALWQRDLGGRILDLEVVTASSGNDVLAASTSAGLLTFLSPVSGSTLRQTNRYGQVKKIIAAPDLGAEESSEEVISEVALLTLGSDARLQGLDTNLNLVEGWQTSFSEPPQQIERLENSLLATWNSGQLVRLSLGSLTPLQRIWTINGAQRPVSVLWQDLDGDGREDLVTGGNLGTIGLYSTDGEATESVELASPIFDLGFISQQGLQSLIAISENGILTSLSARPNRPPFLANAVALPTGDQYSISVTANDIDGDPVKVILQVWDYDELVWRSMGEREAPAAANRLIWNIDLPQPDTPVRYRFFFDDGTYAGSVEPTPGVAIQGQQFPFNYLLIGAFLMVLILLAVLLRQFFNAVPVRGRRMYRNLTAQPEFVLANLNDIFRATTGSADLLLNISGRARRDGRAALADLCDGLYLLPDRPGTAIEILSQSLDAEEAQDWVDVELWRELFELTNDLYSAPSIVELGLFLDRMEEFLPHISEIDVEGESFEQLAIPMEPLEAVGRVEMARDRIAFLQEGLVLLQQEENTMMWRPYTISNQLAVAINMRWQALTNATIEELRGRPWLIPSLKTRRLIAAGESVVALELFNNGQAAAENVEVSLEEDPAYSIVNAEQSIPFLAVGRTTTLEFKITPHEPADLRLAFEIKFQDAAHRNHGFDFADMATMISTDRPFSPVRNPYAPGTPLRRQSPLFYGRQEILKFIIQTIQSTSQSNVIVLVGQRRTGKTSTLLHLSDVAPPDILPVYVDCQSLGVSQG